MEYKINTTLPISFEKVDNPPYLNDSRWQMYKAWICHDLENYNGSYFDVSVLEKMGQRLAGIPVVGYISTNNVNENDFNGHEERLCIQDGNISIEYLGRAYGCVLENNDWKIEQKQHEDGSMRNYLTCNCLVWNMFSEAINIFERDGKKSQSMELQEGSIQGKFEKDGYFHFTDATIRALCVLGEGVSPAMSNSVIEKFSKVDFDSQVKELLSEINESIKQFSKNQSSIKDIDINNTDKGGSDLDKLELIAKYNLTVEQLDFSIDELSIEQLEEKLKEFTAKVNKPEITFSATYRQKREALQNALDPKIEKDAEGKITYEEYLWVNDFDDTHVFVEKTIWTPDYENKYGRYTYTFDEKELKATITSEFEEMVLTWLTLEENQKLQEERNSATTEYEKLKGEYEDYKNNYSTPNTEVNILKEYQTTKLAEERQIAETEIFSQYEESLNDVEGFKELKTNSANFSLEELEKELALLYVKKNTQFSASKSNTKSIKINVNKSIEGDEPYGGLVDKYLNK